jgi:hypothetical protein
MIELGFGDKALTTIKKVSLGEQFVNQMHYSSPKGQAIERPAGLSAPLRAAPQALHVLDT